jgi:hypothetical protein
MFQIMEEGRCLIKNTYGLLMRYIIVFQACSIMNPYIFQENPDVGGPNYSNLSFEENNNIRLSAHDTRAQDSLGLGK